jgi:DNA-directed RNA polymerase specialized sigma24 family protein
VVGDVPRRHDRVPGPAIDANVEAWLVTIAHRKAIDVIRAARRRPLAVAGVPDSVSSDAADGIGRLRRAYPAGDSTSSPGSSA